MAEKAEALEQNNIDPAELSRSLVEIAGKAQNLVADFLAREEAAHHISVHDALHMSGLFRQLVGRMMANPVPLIQAQMAFWQDYMNLLRGSTLRMWGFESEPVIEPTKGDKRFRADAWEDNPVFDFIKQSYLLAADFLHSSVKNAHGMDELTAKKVDFYTRAYIDAMSPTNFAATNPEVIQKAVETRGQNLLNGLKNMLDDFSRGQGSLRIRMTDLDAFEVGENLAITPGKVVFENDMMQLIQYTPTTEKVYKRPIMFIPPWINKFYIVDLQPKNSMIKWLVDQGYTMFVVSWKNPTAEHAEKGFDDYLVDGPLKAMDVIEKITGEKEMSAVGYCLGGTLLSCLLAYNAEKGDERIKSASFFTSMIDFEQPGELEIFIDEDQIAGLEKKMSEKGFLDGRVMANTFNMLRANDLVWSFFVNNYLQGEDPFPFDLLYWNSDSTNMPAKMHSYYLRNMYQANKLREPGGIELAGVPIDLSKVKVPCYFISAIDDHIAPWKSTYMGTHLMSGDVKFVLGGSGHIAGIINPPAKNKYCYWTNPKLADEPEAWLEGATQNEGSWWPDWDNWLSNKSGAKVAAREPGSAKFKPIEDAPGRYVKERL